MGFGREIKDFLAAMQAGQKLVGSADDAEYKRARTKYLRAQTEKLTDPESLKLSKDVLRARANRLNRGPQMRPMHPAQQRALDARTDYYKLRQEQLKNPPKVPNAADDLPSLGTPPSGKQSALDLGEEFDTAENDPALLEETEQYAARGGLIQSKRKVKGYDDGGFVEDDDGDVVEPDDDLDDDLDEEPVGAIPTATASAPATTRTAAARPGYSAQAAHDGVLEGLQYAAKETGAMAEGAIEVSSQRRMGGQRALAMGAGAASVDEMNSVRKAIDPQSKMSESERNMAALAHVYEWNLKQNNPQGAQRAAASMVQYFRQVSGRYKAIAAAAAEKGDVDGAMNAILKAHANIPDGKDIKLAKREDGSVAYSFVDTQSGKTIEKGVASPEQILQFATRGGAMSFEDLISRAAGERAGTGTGKPAREARTPKLDDRDKAMEKINEVADDPKQAKLDEELGPSVKHIASQIIGSNDVPAKDALGITLQLATVGTAPPKIAKAPDGGAVATLPDGREIKLSKDAFGNLVALRGKAQVRYDAAQRTSAEKAARDKKRSGLEADQSAAAAAIPPGSGMLPRQVKPAPYGNPLSELHSRGRVSGVPVRPAPGMSDIDHINAARRTQGLPPITAEQLPGMGIPN